MSWSLMLQNGDLALSGAQLATATDSRKLLQDLRCAVLEPLGTDDMHPTYGSQAENAIGLDVQRAASYISSEIQRIAGNYQQQQLARAKREKLTYNRVSLTPAEVLLSITNLKMSNLGDTLYVSVTLQTADGQSIDAVFSVPGNS